MLKTENLLLTGGDVEISAAGKTPTVTIIAYSGGLMNVPGWGQIVIDLSGVDLSSPQVSILADHDSSLKGVVGHGRALVRSGRPRATAWRLPKSIRESSTAPLAIDKQCVRGSDVDRKALLEHCRERQLENDTRGGNPQAVAPGRKLSNRGGS